MYKTIPKREMVGDYQDRSTLACFGKGVALYMVPDIKKLPFEVEGSIEFEKQDPYPFMPGFCHRATK
jgi:hypothetical protein